MSSNSWGSPDGLGNAGTANVMFDAAIDSGLASGFNGKGTVYVWAAGNGGNIDDSNLDEYNNYYGVVSVCAVNEHGKRPENPIYSEKGENLWVCAPSHGDGVGIATLTYFDRYLRSFGGTSASTPIVAGVVAQMRAENAALTWRDVKLILAASARRNDTSDSDWSKGQLRYRSVDDADRYWFNNQYGFGVVDSLAAVNMARNWTLLPAMITQDMPSTDESFTIPDDNDAQTAPTVVTKTVTFDNAIDFVEFVQLDTDIDALSFRSLHIELESPSGTVSVMSPELDDANGDNLTALKEAFRFGSARHLGEPAEGVWTLRVSDQESGTLVNSETNLEELATVESWGVKLFGHRDAGANAAPVFSDVDYPSAVVARSVAENTVSGVLGDPIIATDDDGDTLVYSVAATATDSVAVDNLMDFNRDFALDSGSGQISVNATAKINFEDRSTYTVQFQVSDGKDDSGVAETAPLTIDATLRLTVTVTNVDEAGVVTITGTVQVGEELTASLTDPDGSVTTEVWKWLKLDGRFDDIDGATDASYTPVGADEGMFLRASVTYTDGFGSDRTASRTNSSPVQPAEEVHTVPAFDAGDYPGDVAARSLAENTTSGAVGAAITAVDGDGDVLTYSVAATADGDGAAHLAAFNRDFVLDDGSGLISVKAGAAIDFESRTVYKVLYQVSDRKDALGVAETAPLTIDDMLTLTVTVTNVDEAGTVAVGGTPQAGVASTASLTDPDGSLSSQAWKWSKGATRSGTFDDIGGATGVSYTPVEADVGMFLRASVTYTDGFGAGRTASGTAGSAVVAAAEVHTVPAFDAGAELHTTVYVNSLDQDRHSMRTMNVVSDFVALPFSTGGTAADEFKVSRVRVPMAVPTNTTVTAEIWGSFGGDPNPNSRLFTLSAPDEIDNDLTTVEEFKATTPVTLTGGGFYYLVLSKPAGSGNFQIPRRKEVGSFTNNGWQLHRPRYDSNSGVDVYTWGNAFENHVALMAIDFSEIRSVDENSASGVRVDSRVVATDDDGDTLTYSVVATDATSAAMAHLTAFNEDFSVDARTGQISVNSGAKINFENRESYTVVFQVSDGEDASGAADAVIDDTLTLTVNVTNVNEDGTVTITGTPQVGEELTASLVDPDGETSGVTWQWSRGDSPSGMFDDITDAEAAAYTPVAADAGKYLLATATYRDVVHEVDVQTAAGTTAAAVTSAPRFALDQGTVQVDSLAGTDVTSSPSRTNTPTLHLIQSFTTGGTISDEFVLFRCAFVHRGSGGRVAHGADLVGRLHR